MTREEAIEKVRKLLALSKSNNPHEAALAAQRAQEILEKYEIERAMLDLSETPEDKEQIEKTFGDASQRMSAWKGMLADALCRVNACRCLIFTSGCTRSKRLEIIGKPSDAQKVFYLFQLLCADVDRLTKRDCVGMGKSYSNNYRHGMVKAITEKLHEARKQARGAMYAQAAGNTTALVRIDQAIAKINQKDREVDLWIKDNLKVRNRSTLGGTYNPDARSHGYSVGKREVNVGSQARAGLGAAKKAIRG